jgi:hypothetical protein
VFFVRVANKGVRLDAASRFVVCRLGSLKVGMLKVEGREPNAEALGAHREEKKSEGEDDWTECEESMK